MSDIVIVDESRLARHRARQPLTEAGHEVREAADVDGAWTAIEERVPDAVVADAELPGRGVDELLAGLEDEVPAVIVAADRDEALEAEDLRERGATDVLVKGPLYGVRVANAVERAASLPPSEDEDEARTVLVVDDSPLIRRVVADALTEDEGRFVVEEASDGETGLQRLHDGIDVVLIDHHLPHTDGVELLDEMREAGQAPPALALVSQRDPELAEGFREAGALGVWVKEHERPGRLRALVDQLARIDRAEVGQRAPPTSGG